MLLQVDVNHPNCPETYIASGIEINNNTLYLTLHKPHYGRYDRTIRLHKEDTISITDYHE